MPDEPFPLFGTIESNSSKNTTQGIIFLAFSKTSRTAASLAPIYL